MAGTEGVEVVSEMQCELTTGHAWYALIINLLCACGGVICFQGT